MIPICFVFWCVQTAQCCGESRPGRAALDWALLTPHPCNSGLIASKSTQQSLEWHQQEEPDNQEMRCALLQIFFSWNQDWCSENWEASHQEDLLLYILINLYQIPVWIKTLLKLSWSQTDIQTCRAASSQIKTRSVFCRPHWSLSNLLSINILNQLYLS